MAFHPESGAGAESEPVILYDKYGDAILNLEEEHETPLLSPGKVLNLTLARTDPTRLVIDPIRWQEFFYEQWELFHPTTPELLDALHFSRTTLDGHWSPELNRILSYMRRYGRLVEKGTIAQGLFYIVPETARSEIEQDLAEPYAAFATDIQELAHRLAITLSLK